MPLPIAHSLAGAAIYRGLDADGTLVTWPRLLLAIVIANSPDLDFLPGILAGEPNLYHHVGPTHSAVFAVFAAVVVGLLAAAAGRAWPVVRGGTSAIAGTALMVGLLLLSHVALDAFARDTRPPIGVPMWWPLSDAAVNVYPWFIDVDKMGGEGTPLQFALSLLNAHNAQAILWEILTVAPVLAAVHLWRRHKDQQQGG